ncbi:unnamed protein product, partial [Sphacelaria rigidula]
ISRVVSVRSCTLPKHSLPCVAHPSQEGTTTIDLIQTIVDRPAPKLDATRFSPSFCRFVESCLHSDPSDRLPAEALLRSPWLNVSGALNLASATTNVKSWINEMLEK